MGRIIYFSRIIYMGKREIKFRVWDKKTKSFWEDGKADKGGRSWNEDWLCITLKGEVAIFDDEPYGGWSGEQGRFVIQQYTGLEDKNGKEIYEGDILNIKGTWWNASGPAGFSSFIQEVKWVEEETGFSPFAIYDTDCGVYHNASECEVIGNIYENPDLIS
jgi:hypothetical protein